MDECIDTITGVKIAFPMHLKLPSAQRAVVTAISLLTVPASADQDLPFLKTANDLVSIQLWNYVYGLFGYKAEVLKVYCAASKVYMLCKHGVSSRSSHQATSWLPPTC